VPERIVLIVNPAATRSGPTMLRQAESALAPLGLVDVMLTERAGHAVELASRAREEDATAVVVLGGDGTVNEVAGALAGSGIGLAALPAGSTNVFARALGWPHPATRALPAVAEALRAPTWRTVRLGRIEAGSTDRVFCVNAGIGLDAETVHLVEARPWLKRRFRQAGFAGATLVAALRAARHAPDLAVRADDRDAEHMTTVIVACGAPYAYLGRRALDLAPGADFGDRLRWMGLRTARLRTVGGAVAGAFRGGRHLTMRSVAAGWADHQVVVDADRPVAVQADGEPLGWHTHVRLSHGPVLRTLVAAAR
jgi:diacylglycerol kinase family enzyme